MTNEEKQKYFAEINPLVNALFDTSEDILIEKGDITPHGAALMQDGELKYMNIDTGDETPNAKAVLSVIHAGLRQQTLEQDVLGVGSAETVMVGEPPEPAIKVFAEHKSGFCMAFYLPFQMKGEGEYDFKDVIRVDSKRLISGWDRAKDA